MEAKRAVEVIRYIYRGLYSSDMEAKRVVEVIFIDFSFTPSGSKATQYMITSVEKKNRIYTYPPCSPVFIRGWKEFEFWGWGR